MTSPLPLTSLQRDATGVHAPDLPPPTGPTASTIRLIPVRPRHRRPFISCVVPCRNEARNLERLLPLLQAILSDATSMWEVVVVDDGSTDDTVECMSTWCRHAGFRLLQLSRNFGKEAALTAGLAAADGDVVILMDADLQHPPALIPTLLDAWRQGADMAYAQRTDRDDESRFKQWGSRWFYRLLNASERVQIPAGASDFRLMDRAVVNSLLALPERQRFMKGLYAWVGYAATPVPYKPEPRWQGSSHYSPAKLAALAVSGLTAFTTWPLRAISAIGLTLAALAFGYGAFLIFAYLVEGNHVSGWTTLAVSLMLFSGLQLVSLGIVGEYVGRIFEEAKQRPNFIIKATSGRAYRGHP